MKAKSILIILVIAGLNSTAAADPVQPCWIQLETVEVSVDLECVDIELDGCGDSGTIYNNCDSEISVTYPEGLRGDDRISAGTAGTFWGYLNQDTEQDGEFTFAIQLTQGEDEYDADVDVEGSRYQWVDEEEGCQVAPGAGVSMPFSILLVLGLALATRRKTDLQAPFR